MTTAPDERVVRLYGLPLAEFTPERNALAAELRAEGDSEAAAAVKSLRKPTAAAWAVNQLVRAEPDLVEALLGAGGELRQAHRQAASGRGAEQLRAAAEAERAAVELLMSRARAALGGPPTPTLADAIRNTLHAASSDDEARQQVRAGTLTAPLRPVGLGPLPGGMDAGRAGGRAPKEDKAESKRRAAELAARLKAAKAAETALLREVAAAERALARAEGVYTRAREAAELASERAAEARARLRGARNALQDAQRRLGELERGS